MTFSHSQISAYLRCPRSYRYRYLDGWREKESRAALCFGRAFEKALGRFSAVRMLVRFYFRSGELTAMLHWSIPVAMALYANAALAMHPPTHLAGNRAIEWDECRCSTCGHSKRSRTRSTETQEKSGIM